MIEPLGDQDYGFMSFVLLLVYAIQDLRGKPDGLDPSVFFLTRLRLRARALALSFIMTAAIIALLLERVDNSAADAEADAG